MEKAKTNLISILGCNLSPLLFSLFINNLGHELNSTGLGIDLGSLNVSSLLFADDIILIGSSRTALDQLMTKTRAFFSNHHLTLSETKSKIMTYEAATGKTVFHGSSSIPPLSLDQVLSFKYLGVPLSSSPYSLFKSFNDQVKKRAKDYFTRVLSLTKSGPDRCSLAYSLWVQVALPSILYGSEIIPLTQCTITEVEKYQSSIGKFILQLPRSSSNVSGFLDGGLKPIWATIAEKVLLYAQSTMFKPLDFWPKIAMKENLLLGPKSPYTRYLLKWKEATDSSNFDPKRIRASVKKSAIASIMSQQRLTVTSTFAMSPPGSSTANPWFRPKPWVTDSCLSQLFSQFRSCNAGFGNRGPAKDGHIYKLCPLCALHGLKSLNNEVRFLKQGFNKTTQQQIFPGTCADRLPPHGTLQKCL